MADLRVNVAGVEFANPLIAASGTFGFGREYNEFYPLSVLGGISCKGITIKERPGNPPPRVTETPGGMLNAVGLQNPGVDHFIQEDLPWLSQQGTKIIANVAGNAPEDYCATVEKLNDTCVDMIELNISCPNVKQGGVQFGTTTEGVYGITSEVRKHCKKPLVVKLSPNVTDISEMAVAAESAGADAISMINTLTGMRIDIHTRRPIIRNNTGGMSGPALLPIALRMVWKCSWRAPPLCRSVQCCLPIPTLPLRLPRACPNIWTKTGSRACPNSQGVCVRGDHLVHCPPLPVGREFLRTVPGPV